MSPKKAPPSHLTEARKATWVKLADHYGLHNDPSALDTLRLALESLDLIDSCREAIARDGLTVKGPRGNIASHPLLPTMRDAKSAFIQAMKSLGLEPIGAA